MATLVVAAGGALGAVARYWASEWVRFWAGDAFPWGTLTVNLLGSFAIGFLMVWLQSMAPSAQSRQFLAVGFLGSFTTFSTFSHETLALLEEGTWGRAALYSLGSLALGIVAVYLGITLSRFVLQVRP